MTNFSPASAMAGSDGSIHKPGESVVGDLSGVGPARLGGGGGPTPPYAAKAVHFDIGTNISNLALVCADAGTFTNIICIKHYGIPGGAYRPIWTIDPAVNYWSYCDLDDTVGSQCSLFDGASGDVSIDVNTTLLPEIWYIIIESVKTGVVPPHPGQAYVGNTLVVDDFNVPGRDDAFNTPMNGLPFVIGNDGFVDLIADVALLRAMPGVYLCDGSGNIPLETLRLIITADGKLVDPAVLTAAVGSSGVVFSGGLTDWIAQAAAQGFTITGPLTDVPASQGPNA